MFKSLQPGDWIALAALVATIAGGIGLGLWHAWHVARRFGRFETKYEQLDEDVGAIKADLADRPKLKEEHRAMREEVAMLRTGQERMHGMDTTVQLLAQTVNSLGQGLQEFRAESREARAESKIALAEMRGEMKSEMREVRHDLNNKIQLAANAHHRP